MATRDLNRRSVTLILIGGLLSQGIYGGLRALSLQQTRDYALARYAADPSVDIWINVAVLGLAAVFALALLTTRSAAWWAAVAVITVGAVDALRLAVAPYGGVGYWGLLALRGAVLYLYVTPMARTVFGVTRRGSRR